MSEYSQEDLNDEIMVTCCKYMECSICEEEISSTGDDDDDYNLVVEHFKERHGYIDTG